jgi:hypothetical protein
VLLVLEFVGVVSVVRVVSIGVVSVVRVGVGSIRVVSIVRFVGRVWARSLASRTA